MISRVSRSGLAIAAGSAVSLFVVPGPPGDTKSTGSGSGAPLRAGSTITFNPMRRPRRAARFS